MFRRSQAAIAEFAKEPEACLLHVYSAPAVADVPSRLRALRYEAIAHALPAPSQPLSAAQLISFKASHGEQLCRLRSYLYSQLGFLAAIDDDRDRAEMTDEILKGIRSDVAVLTRQMTRRRWPTIVLVGVGGLVASTLAAGATIATGGAAALAIGLGLASEASYIAFSGATLVNLIRAPRIDENAPLAYAALAEAL